MKEREKISTGPNARPVNETIAGTGRGIPDDARGPGEKQVRKPPSDEEVREAAEKLGARGQERESARSKGSS